MTTRALRPIVAALVVLAVAWLTPSCSEASPNPGPPNSSSSLASPSRTATQATMSPAEQNTRDAQKAVMSYLRVIDRLSADPYTKLEDLTTVARGQALAQWRENITNYRRREVKQVGTVVVANPLAEPTARTGEYEVRACVDVSKVDLVDKNGKSVVADDRPPKVTYLFTVREDAPRWYVVDEKATGTC
jgi:hypothetical protein